MKPGNLVRITRASIGVPLGSIGLILFLYPADGDTWSYYNVLMVGADRRRNYLKRDLEVVS